MSKILMLKGLPASGKSTYAKELLNRGGWKRVNKDDLRLMVDNGKWSKGNEKMIVQLRDAMVSTIIVRQQSVIVDDTNFAPQHEAKLREIADHFKIPFEVRFFDTPVEECIERDLMRARSVGKDVIMKMYNEYLRPKAPVYLPPKNGTASIIVDIDGTLAHMVDRSPYDPSLYHTDTVDSVIRDLVNHYAAKGYVVIVCSGRGSEYRPATVKWLDANDIEYDYLFMRPVDDKRKDSIVKRELFEENIAEKYDVRFVLDDRNQVVDMWRNELGLKVLQVAEGDF